MPTMHPLYAAIEEIIPHSPVPCFDAAARAAFQAELYQLGHGYKDCSYGLTPLLECDFGKTLTLPDMLQQLQNPDLQASTDFAGDDRRSHHLKQVQVRRFIQRVLQTYQQHLPGLQVSALRMQVFHDNRADPYNPGGLLVHTDDWPKWDSARPGYANKSIRLCAAACTLDPGTNVLRLQRPLAHGGPLAKLMRAKVRRNRGPAAALLRQTLNHEPGAARIVQNTGGSIGLFHGESLHWRGELAPGQDDLKRGFVALDLYIPANDHNRRIIMAALRQHRAQRRALAGKNPLAGLAPSR